jgi:hypothetical protein
MSVVNVYTLDIFMKKMTKEQRENFRKRQCEALTDFLEELDETEADLLIDRVENKWKLVRKDRIRTVLRKICNCRYDIKTLEDEVKSQQKKFSALENDENIPEHYKGKLMDFLKNDLESLQMKLKHSTILLDFLQKENEALEEYKMSDPED